ncbi:hypothetical protein BK704_33890 [[Bacillus thuringiensis] serovar konkukian]|nr:hypothetical protein BK704_33890 [[Bacillus thuringiensis] serovar konkukian]
MFMFFLIQKNNLGSALLILGIGSLIGLQSIVNLGGVTGIFPLTGTTPPLVGFNGGYLMTMGTLINISIFNKING